MTARLMFATAAMISLTSAALAAEPAKPASRDSTAAAPRELVLASAEVKAPATGDSAQATAPVRRRTARVTTCRCGDPQPQDSGAKTADSE